MRESGADVLRRVASRDNLGVRDHSMLLPQRLASILAKGEKGRSARICDFSQTCSPLQFPAYLNLVTLTIQFMHVLPSHPPRL